MRLSTSKHWDSSNEGIGVLVVHTRGRGVDVRVGGFLVQSVVLLTKDGDTYDHLLPQVGAHPQQISPLEQTPPVRRRHNDAQQHVDVGDCRQQESSFH